MHKYQLTLNGKPLKTMEFQTLLTPYEKSREILKFNPRPMKGNTYDLVKL